jgi:5'-nucleotidase
MNPIFLLNTNAPVSPKEGEVWKDSRSQRRYMLYEGSVVQLALTGRRLFVDLDGFVADFDRHFIDMFGSEAKALSKRDKWALISSQENFFLGMPLMPGALEFFSQILRYDPIILTACPATNFAETARQKRSWSRENLHSDITVIPVHGSINKYLFMHNPGDVLLDDRPDVCALWTLHGGLAIHYEGGSYTSILERVHLAFADQ